MAALAALCIYFGRQKKDDNIDNNENDDEKAENE